MPGYYYLIFHLQSQFWHTLFFTDLPNKDQEPFEDLLVNTMGIHASNLFGLCCLLLLMYKLQTILYYVYFIIILYYYYFILWLFYKINNKYVLYSMRNSPGNNIGVGCHSLLQGIFPIQGSNPVLLHCRQVIYLLNHQGSSLYLSLPLQFPPVKYNL